MAKPQLYINVSQTICVSMVAVFLIDYMVNRSFRLDVNDAVGRIFSGVYR